jgi:hypothetical protein
MTDVVDAITPDTFAMLRHLITVLGDPKRSSEVLAELEARIKAAKQAENRLGTVRERHDIAMAKDRQELEERRDQLNKRGRDLVSREAMVDQREKTLERITRRNTTLVGPGGLTRERDWSDERQDTTR